MGSSLNKVILLGIVTRDPDIRKTGSGTTVCNFGIVMNRKYTTAKDEVKDETTHVDVMVFGKTAENVAQYIGKGSTVLIDGRLHLDQWETKDNPPQQRSKLIVIGERVQFIGSRHDSKEGSVPAERIADRRW